MLTHRPHLKAIPTRYAGCDFRSRLEARWAVFFTALGIEWTYEPDGYTVGPSDDQVNYLPDFYLPDAVDGGIWVEVKGKLHAHDQHKMFHAAHPAHGLPGAAGPLRMLLLGDVPRVDAGWMCWHHALRWQPAGRNAYGTWGDGLRSSLTLITDEGRLRDIGDHGLPLDNWTQANPSVWRFDAYVTAEAAMPSWRAGPRVAAAYTAARSERFGT